MFDRRKKLRTWRMFVVPGIAVVVVAGTLVWQSLNGRIESASMRLSTAGNLLCPVGGMSVNRELVVETQDGPVYFCCEHCVERFTAAPSAYQLTVEAQRRALVAESKPAATRYTQVLENP